VKITNERQQPRLRPQGHHREGIIEFCPLHRGVEGTPGYYTMMIARFEEYYTPRHRHNYDQIRYCFHAPFNYARGKEIPVGWIGYFPEGTHYGPQDVKCAIEDSPAVLTWQFGSTSMQGFLSAGSLSATYEAMSTRGRFERGSYITVGPDGNERREDGYEAAWAEAMQRPLQYPKPKYPEPILMDPQSFAWYPTSQPGVAEKTLGVFGERGLRLSFLRIDVGAEAIIRAHTAVQCAYLVSGSARIEDALHDEGTAIALDPGETLRLVGVDRVELFVVQLPNLSVLPLRD
jgi:hypothetical protein